MGQIERSSLQIVLKESPCIIRSRNTTILIIEPYNIIKWYHFFLIQKRRKSHDYFSREQRGSIECSFPSESANESPCIMGSKNTIILITGLNDIINNVMSSRCEKRRNLMFISQGDKGIKLNAPPQQKVLKKALVQSDQKTQEL